MGDEMLDATGCYVMPGGIDPHTHLEMPFMGTYSADDFESGTRAALSGGTTMVVDFVLPGQGQGLMDAAQMWHNKSGRATCDYSYHMAITWWGEKVWDGHGGCGEGRHHLLQALHGLQGRADGERRRDVRQSSAGWATWAALALVHAENGDVVAELTAKLLAEGNTGPEAHAYSPPAAGGGRGDQPRDHDRRHGGGAALCRAYLLRGGA